MNNNPHRAINLAARLGIRIKNDCPGIAEDYREGAGFKEITRRLELSTFYGYSEGVTKLATAYAITGFRGGYGHEAYSGLIPDREEIKKLRLAHLKKRGKEQAKKDSEAGRGIDGRWERSQLQVFGVEGAIEREFEPWLDSYKDEKGKTVPAELDTLLRLVNDINFQYTHGSHKGLPDLQRVTDKLNEEHHNGNPVRTYDATRCAYVRLRKKIKNARKFED